MANNLNRQSCCKYELRSDKSLPSSTAALRECPPPESTRLVIYFLMQAYNREPVSFGVHGRPNEIVFGFRKRLMVSGVRSRYEDQRMIINFLDLIAQDSRLASWLQKPFISSLAYVTLLET